MTPGRPFGPMSSKSFIPNGPWLDSAGTQPGWPGGPSPGGTLMDEIAYDVRGFITLRRDSERLPLGDRWRSGRIGTRAFSPGISSSASPPSGGRCSGPGSSASPSRSWPLLPSSAGSTGKAGWSRRRWWTRSSPDIRAAGRSLASGGSCRTATQAVVPLHSKPGFDLERGGRLAGRYYRPPFTGCGPVTPLVNLLAAGPGNAAVFDLVPLIGA